MAAAAEAWSAYVAREAATAASMPEPARGIRLDGLERDNRAWDALEAAFGAAWAAYDAAAGPDKAAALALAVAAHDKARAFLHEIGALP